jgi:NAD(P)H-nitrite reductase large subunit
MNSGSGAFGAIQSLRENNYTGPITLISHEPNLPLDRTKLSKALIPDASKLLLRPESWYNDAGITTLTDEVTSIDFSSKTVSTKSGKSHKYSSLILSTGGTPRQLPLAGFKDLKNIFVLRYVTDVQAILSAVGEAKGKNIVIVGSSFIGMEVGNALSKENKVSIIGMESAPLERVMGADVGSVFQKLLEKNGVKFYMSASVDSATPSSSDSSAVGAVKLKDGTELPADLVILGVGVAPETSYLKDNPSVTLLKDGSLEVDESFAVKSLTSVYAIGDIATFPYHGPGGNGSNTRIEHWNVAQNSGRSVAYTITHPGEKPKSFIPIFWSALGSQLRYCGNTVNGFDDIVIKGSKEDAKFAAFYCKGETVVAVATMMMDPVMSKSAELMRTGKMPSKSELEGG